MIFDVCYIDGRPIDWWNDAYKFCKENEWASHLIYCDIDGFAIGEQGDLMLIDDCSNVAYCPRGMFKIIYHINGQDIEQVY